MRQIRIRFRSSIIFILTSLSFFCVLTLHTVLWSNEQLENLIDLPQPPPAAAAAAAAKDKPIWSAFHSTNPAQSAQLPFDQLTVKRLDDLYRLVLLNKGKALTQFPVNTSWNFDWFLARKSPLNFNDTNIPMDAVESGLNRESITTKVSLWKTMTDDDRLQLRYFVIEKLSQWKILHSNDSIVNLADKMSESLLQDEPKRLNTSWFQSMKMISSQRVYNSQSPRLKELFIHLQSSRITYSGEMSQGTQIKVVLDLTDGFQALMKPYRVPRDYQTLPDHFYFSDVERHHAEIAAFHVDKVLGFNRVPPVIGRILDISNDLRATATEEFAKTFFVSPANNTCFRGHCSYYCDTSHAVCGKPGDRLEGSIQLLLPRPPEVDWQKLVHPYRRSYSATRQAKWEMNANFCYEHVLIDDDYHTRLLLDMMDLAAFDFLIGNLDRHHMMRITAFGANTALVHLDNGRSFGRHDFDDLSILTPIRQCCFFRSSTFLRFYELYQRGLSNLIIDSLNQYEPLPNILIVEHLQAIDRRLKILFNQLDKCIRRYTVNAVIIDDGIE